MSPNRTTFVDAVADGFRSWRDFAGTASRPQFWYWFLFTFLVGMVLSTLDAFLFPTPLTDLPSDPSVLTGDDFRLLLDGVAHDLVWSVASVVDLVLLVPTVAITVRRFRDAGLTPWLGAVVRIVPIIATAVILFVGYAAVPAIDDPSTDAMMSLAGSALAFIGLGLASLASTVILLIGGLRRSRSASEGNRYLGV